MVKPVDAVPQCDSGLTPWSAWSIANDTVFKTSDVECLAACGHDGEKGCEMRARPCC